MSFPTWAPDWRPLPGQAVFDLNTQEVAAVSRAPGNLDLFVIGNDGGAGTTNGHVWTTAWTNGIGWNADWRPLPGQAVFDRATQKIAAVARSPGNLDLFVIGNDSHVWTTAWTNGIGWNSDWAPLPGQAVFDLNTQDVAAVSQAAGNLDLFVIGNDSHVWTTAWGLFNANPMITLRAILDAGRFIEVDGTGFTPDQSVKLAYDIINGGGPTSHETGQDTLSSDQAGSFVHRIPVRLAGDINGAQAQATDVASDKTASASL
jgi:hypothetical protein